MKYYEIYDPYYALIKANSVEEAANKYIEFVAGDEEERPMIKKYFEEVERDYALVKFSQARDEFGELIAIDEVIKDFNDRGSDVLLIDRTLL